MKYFIIFFIMLFSSQMYSQDYSWEYISPWRYRSIFNEKYENEKLRIIERQYHQSNNLLEMADDLSHFDTIMSDIDLDFFDYAVVNEDSIYVVISNTIGGNSIVLVNPKTNDKEFILESISYLKLTIQDNTVFVFTNPSPNSNDSYLSRLDDKELTLLFDYDFGDNDSPNFITRQGYLIVFRKYEIFFSKNKGEDWIKIETEHQVINLAVVDNEIANLSLAYEINFYNETGNKTKTLYLDETEIPEHLYSIEKIGETYYLSGEERLRKSTDNNTSWVDIADTYSKFNRKIFNLYSNNNMLYYSGSMGIEVYNTTTEEFKNLNRNYVFRGKSMYSVNDTTLIIHCFAETAYDEFFHSTDGGITWKNSSTYFFQQDSRFSDHILYQTSSNNLYLAISGFYGQFMYKSIDGGYSWALEYEYTDESNSINIVIEDDQIYKRNKNEIAFNNDFDDNFEDIPINLGEEARIHDVFRCNNGHVAIYAYDTSIDTAYLFIVEGATIIKNFHYQDSLREIRFVNTVDGIYANFKDSLSLIDENFELLGLISEGLIPFVHAKINNKYLTSLNIETEDAQSFLTEDILAINQNELIAVNNELITPTRDNYHYISYASDAYVIYQGGAIRYGDPFERSIITGPEEIEYYTDNELVIYPNPFYDFIAIKSEMHLYHELYTISGQRIMQTTENTINTSSLDSGMYVLVSYENGKQVSSRKVVK